MPDHGFTIFRFDRLDGTNAEALRRGAVPGEAIVAAEQSAGRGREGRAWASPPGNLYATLVVPTPAPGRNPAHLSFAAGLAVREALAAFAPDAPFVLKWPNDVLAGGRKIAGILIEAGEGGYAVGVGINLISAPRDGEVRFPATDLRTASGRTVAPDEILEELCARLGFWCGRLDAEGFAPLREAWLASAHRIGDTIAASVGTTRLDGRFAGLDEDGALLLDDDGGNRHVIAAGDVLFSGAP